MNSCNIHFNENDPKINIVSIIGSQSTGKSK